MPVSMILDRMTEGVFALDRDWRVTFVNRRAEALLRRPRAQLLGRRIWDEFPDARGSVFHVEYERAVTEQVPVQFEAFYPPFGTWFRVHAYPSADGLWVHVLDVTERMHAVAERQRLLAREAQARAEAEAARLEAQRASAALGKATRALGQSATDLQTLLDMIPIGIGVSDDPECRRIVPNRALAELLRVPPGVNFSKSAAPGEQPTFTLSRDGREVPPDELTLQYAMSRGVVVRNAELDISWPDGTRRNLLEWAAPRVDDRGRVCGGFLAVVDITERKRGEMAARGLAALVESSPDAIVGTTADGIITSWNAAAERIHGYSAEEAVGRPVAMLVPADRAHEVPELFGRLSRRERVEAFETVRLHRTGARIDVSLTVFPIPGGGTTAYAWIARDITAPKQAEAALRASEERLRQAQKMEAIGQLAGGVAHDFNNLLTAIAGYSALLRERLGDDGPVRRDIEEIQKAADRAATLTRQLLAFSRRQVLQPTVLDLNDVLAEMEKMLRRVIGEHIELMTVPSPEPAGVKADRGQLEQVLMNLAVNARDAMAAGGRLTFETACVDLDDAYAARHVAVVPGPYVLLAASDTGCGMTPDVQARIFEPFFTTKPPGQGTGLGLSTVYGIVKQSGGNIWVYSEPGHGTTFKIYLPRVEGRVETRAPAIAPTAPAGAGETILVVEDDERVRSLVRKVLEGKGYTVLQADRGDDALAICTQHRGPISLVLTDLVMPGMGGREAAEQVSRRHPGVRILYMSGYTQQAILRKQVFDPGTAFLSKPFTPDALARKVREVLDAPGQ